MERVFTTSLRTPPETLWRWAASAEGVNSELMPLLRMTGLKSFEDIQAIDFHPGEAVCTSWLLLFGLLPVDRIRLTLLEYEAGTRFVEQSPMLTMRLWRHERTIRDDGGTGSVLEDRLTFQGRVPGPLTGAIVGLIFQHRHRRLRRHFGEG